MRVAVGVLAAGIVLGACGGESTAAEGPNLVVVTLDTTRADHLGCYGYFRDTTPHLDRFAAESVVFERCVTPMATTLPAHTSLFTGLHPLEHGVLANLDHGGRRFEPVAGLRPIAAVLADAGYETAAFVSSLPVKRRSGIEVGFEVWSEPGPNQREGGETVSEVLDWWRARDDERPFFLWVHLFDAHYPLSTPPGYEERFAADEALAAHFAERRIVPRKKVTPEELFVGYDAELFYQDEVLGELLDELQASEEWERTAVVVVGDHGEGLLQHNDRAHGGTWDEQLRVPLIVRWPGVAPRREPRALSVIDVLPTVLGALEVPGTEPFLSAARGVDVLASEPRRVLSQDTGREQRSDYHRLALTGRRWKYLRYEYDDERVEEELYDLAADPFELSSVAAEHPDTVAELRTEALRLRAAYEERARALGVGESSGEAVDPETLEGLRELGYTGY